MSQPNDGVQKQGSRIFVTVPDTPGYLAKVTEALGEAGVNIESIDGRAIGESSIIKLQTSDDDAALHALLEAGLKAVTSDALLFHLPDRPGALASVARIVGNAGLNVRTIHIVHRLEGRAIIAMTTDDDDVARSVLDKHTLL